MLLAYLSGRVAPFFSDGTAPKSQKEWFHRPNQSAFSADYLLCCDVIDSRGPSSATTRVPDICTTNTTASRRKKHQGMYYVALKAQGTW